ncbi:MAG: CPBP family intramembrane metalloprotease [Verrucomicrobiales bacterium]|nr:CPBP family intramembrane metalloprotease [Verrucomicrobiales bacterium]
MNSPTTVGKNFSTPMLICSLIAYLAIIQGSNHLLTADRDYGYASYPDTESIIRSTTIPVALSVLFVIGLVHISNIFTEGPGAFFQAGVASASGLLLYVCLRVSGSLWLPIMLHAGWDFSLFSSNLGNDPKPYLFSPIALLLIPILTIIVWIKWRSIWPSPPRSSA